MGIVNLTPDSFSDGGALATSDLAVAHALRLVEEGADLLDIGAESSRPGAESVPLEEEWSRLRPVLERLSKTANVPLSVDTCKAEVARRALETGAHVVNDITGLEDPAMRAVVREARAGAVVMHMQGRPRTMQDQPVYGDVVQDLCAWFTDRLQTIEEVGMPKEALVIDPGMGFGKTADHNLTILSRLTEFGALGYPVLVGPSRKAFIGKVLNLPVTDRLEGTAAAIAVAVWNGAKIVRVHDVKAMRRVVHMVHAIKSCGRVDG